MNWQDRPNWPALPEKMNVLGNVWKKRGYEMRKSIIALLVGVLILCPFVNAFALTSVTAAVTAQNTGTTAVQIKGPGTLRISGTFTATVSLQRTENCTSPPACVGATWVDTGDTWTGTGSAVSLVVPFHDYTGRQYRLWVETGNYTSGTVNLELGSPN